MTQNTETQTPARQVDYRELMKKVEQLVEMIGGSGDVTTTIRNVTGGIIDRFRDELGIYGGRIYRREGSDYILDATFGAAKDAPRGLRVPDSYAPTEQVLEHGTLFMSVDDPGIDRELEDRLGVTEFAAIEVGDSDYILAFDVTAGSDREDVLFSLGILRHSINQKIREEQIASIFNEARAIQASILPRKAPAYGDFDIAGRTDPMEIVGGDFYDYIPLTDKILGLAIADVSGHGLPAALQVRDVFMGLRMGMARDFKIVRTMQRLNSIIHTSTLTSRFVSLFYGELELNGVFIYVNAGHPPPFHLSVAGEVRFLDEGGPVLGPLPETTYERGFVTMRPGDVLVMYTDGILETRGQTLDGAWDEFGAERLVESVRTNQRRTAEEIVDALFGDVDAFSEGRQAKDDRTAVVVKIPTQG